MKARWRQGGLTVVELMVAAAIGALVTLLALQLLLATKAAYVAQTEAAAVNDAGRFALAVIERSARQAGFVDWSDAEAATVFGAALPPAVYGMDAASLSAATAAVGSPRPPVANGSDILALQFSGSGSGAGDGSAISCAGFAVGAAQRGWSIFYVSESGAGDTELRCKYKGANGWSADAVVGGVDAFQVLYGVDTDAVADGVANGYLSAGAISAIDAALVLLESGEAEREQERIRRSMWQRVASIRVALVLHGARHSVTARDPAVWHLFGDAYAAGAVADPGTVLYDAAFDPKLRQRERKQFSATILLRNRQRQGTT